MIKNLLALILILVMTFTLASCEFPNVGGSGTLPQESTITEKPTPTEPSTTQPSSTTTTKKDEPNNPSEDDHIYTSFTASEKQIMIDLFGEVIPFIPNDEYYVESFAQDNDDGTTSIGISFYTFGNTKAEFDAYRSLFSAHVVIATK